jgi:hypothetical protein
VSESISTPTLDAPAISHARTRTGMSNAELAALWAEARFAYPTYAALAVQFNLAPLPYHAGELPPARPTRNLFDRDLNWLDAIDEHLLAYQLRQVPSQILNGSEPGLRAFIQRQLKRPHKTTLDRDKIDWLLGQYFALCAPEELYRQEVKLEDVASVLLPVITASAKPQECCEPLEQILADLEKCHSLRDVMENGTFEQGRLVKDAAGDMFYDPAALVAFCRFNFLLRRAFIRLLHTDLKSMGEAIDTLEARGKKTVDCRRAGLSAAETTAQLRYFCGNWKQPFQKDYTESSVTRSFEQLIALRTDLEEAIRLAEAKGFRAMPERFAPDLQSAHRLIDSVVPEDTEVTPSISDSSPSTGDAEAEKCHSAIRAQLTDPATFGGQSMSTVSLQDTKVLLSAWEVKAFVSHSDDKSMDLRRAVVARALLAVAIDQRKRSGEEHALDSALAHARSESSYFQGRIDRAKQMKNIEAAINLGISAKRLLSFIEEAKSLQP